MKKIIGFLLVVVSLGMIGFGVYKLFMSPKITMLSYIQKEMSKIELEKEDATPVKQKISSTGNIKFKDDNIGIKGDFYLDSENLKYYLNYIINYMNEDIKTEIYFENNKLYYKFLDQFNYYDLSKIDVDNSKISDKEINELINVISKTLKDDLKDEFFNKNNESIMINSKSVKVDKYQMKLTAQDFYEYVNKLLSDIESNTNLPTIKNILFENISKAEILSKIKTNIVSVLGPNKDFIKYSIYVDNNKIIRHELSLIDTDDTLNITLDSLEDSTDKSKKEIKISNNNKTLINGIYDKDKEKTTFNLNIDNYSMDISITENDNKVINASLYVTNGQKVEIGTFTLTTNKTTNDKEYSANLIIKIPSINFDLTLNNNIKIDEEVPKFDTNGAKKKELNKLDIENML